MIEQRQQHAEPHLRDAENDRHFHLERVLEDELVVSQRPNLLYYGIS